MVEQRQPREEIAFEKFVDTALKFVKLDDPDISDDDIAEMKAEMMEEGQVRTALTQALNEFLWEQDGVITATIRETYTNLQDLIKATIPEADRGEETGKILQMIDELVEAEDTEEEMLSADDLKELTSDDEDDSKPIIL